MRNQALDRIEGIDGKKPDIEHTPTGWHFRTPTGLKARIKGFRDGIICRIGSGENTDVVQLGIGPATSSLCNALYSPSTDTALVCKADGLSIEPAQKGRGFAIACAGPLTIKVMEDYMRIHQSLPWFRPMEKKHFRRPPAGWCSWYYYYLNITEEEVVKNTDWLAANLKQFGCEWVQIDDGWQGRGNGLGSNRDWFVTSDKDFPSGMKWSADYIRSKGLRPGIWCIPVTQSNTELWEKQPSLFVHNEDGTSPGDLAEPWHDGIPEEDRCVSWPGKYYIDPTSQDAQVYLRRLFKMICDEWGYDYVKIDAQGIMSDFYDEHRARMADPSLSGDRAYRYGLQAMKETMGDGRYLLNCGHNFDSAGYCEGIRIGGDVELKWEGIRPAIDSTMRWLFLNNIMFHTDPDVVCVREPLPFEQAELWASLLAITGQLLMASDKMYELPDERVELLRRIFPVADIHPMELNPLRGEKPGIFDLKVCKPGVGDWDVVALFNWSETEPRVFELSAEKLGLEQGDWICIDSRSGDMIHKGDGSIRQEVPTTSSRVISYWRDENRPRFVGTNRHLTQGGVDVESLKWDDAKLRLSGVSDVVGRDPYVIRVYVPEGYAVKTKGVEQEGRIARLMINKNKNTRVRWRLDFIRMS